jgi:hypothetical protein
MISKYIKISGINKTFELISKSTLPGRKDQLVIKDDENVKYVFTRNAGGFTYIKPTVNQINDIEDS